MTFEEKESIDFQFQFLMCKGLDIVEDTLKQEMFGDVQDMIEATQHQIQLQSAAIAIVLQSKEGITDMTQVKSKILKLIEGLSPIKSLIDNYKETRRSHLE